MISFDDAFNTNSQTIELADGSRSTGLVQGREVACVHLHDSEAVEKEVGNIKGCIVCTILQPEHIFGTGRNK